MQNDHFANEPTLNQPITPFKWMLYIIVSSLPLIGTIMLLVWAFGNDGKVARQNWAKGMLLFYVIAIVLSLLFFFIFGAAIIAASSGSSY